MIASARAAWIIARVLAALPLRGSAWACAGVGFAGWRLGALLGWVADWIEGV